MSVFERLVTRLVVFSSVFRLPLWTAQSMIPALRPRRSWSLTKCLYIRFLRFVFLDLGRQRLRHIYATADPKELRLGKNVLGIYVDPVPTSFLVDPLSTWAEKANVAAERIPGYWLHRPAGAEIVEMGARPSADEKVAYFLHGGAYVAFSAHPSEQTSRIPRFLIQKCPSIKRSFAVEYRLTSMLPNAVDGPFPSALIDALSGYYYLINTVGYRPDQIVIVGDSAGGNLALALTRYLVDATGKVEGLPAVPGALILLSPWVDMSGSWCSPGSSYYTNSPFDFVGDTSKMPPYTPSVPPHFVEPFGRSFVSETAYVSPGCKSLEDVSYAGFPRMFIAAGTAEMLFDQINAFQARTKMSLGDDSGKVVYFEAEDAVHDYMCLLFMEPETTRTMEAIVKFVEGMQ